MSQIELSRYFDFVERLQSSNTLEELTGNCRWIADELEFSRFLYGAFLPAIEEVVVLDGFPHPWREHYDKHNCIEIDPTVKHCWSSTQPISWADLSFSKGRRGDRELLFMSQAHDFGLISGTSVPIHGAGAEGGMLSLVDDKKGREFTRAELSTLLFVGQSVHEELKRVIGNRKEGNKRQNELTERELECLRWTASGKTSWEISIILSISESTVIFHIKNAIDKLQVTNRSQAVAKAIAQSRIVLF